MSMDTRPQTSSKKNIVFFTASLEGGGAERVISIVTKYLVTNHYHVEILLYYNRPVLYTIHPDVKITSVEKESHSRNIIKNLFWMRKFFKNHASVIISFLASFNILAVIANLGLSSKIIVADRVDPWLIPANPILRKIRDLAYHLADAVTVQTHHNKAYFPTTMQKKVSVIYNPIDLGDKRGQALRTPKQDRIVYVGRLKPQKNQKMLLEAFAQIKDKFPTYSITFYGAGPLREELEKLSQELGLAKRVFFAGNIKNIFDEISNAKLFVLTSNYEGMSNALAEALCLGLPVISTDVSGATELIENGKSGFIIPRDNPQKLALVMKKVLLDETLQNELGKHAIKLNDKLEVSAIVKQWINLIRRVETK